MLAVVIVLIVTNLAALGALGYVMLRPVPPPRPDPRLGAALDGTLAASVTRTGTRRIISVEVLNVIELAGTRGRLAGIAGSLVPGLTARIVYDQTIKTMRRQLAAERVVADVRMHTLSRVEPEPRARPGRPKVIEAPAGADPAGPSATPPTEVVTDDTTTDQVERTTTDGLDHVEEPPDTGRADG